MVASHFRKAVNSQKNNPSASVTHNWKLDGQIQMVKLPMAAKETNQYFLPIVVNFFLISFIYEDVEA